MSYDTIVQLISTVGFPICMVVCMAWYILQRDKKEQSMVENYNNTIDELSSVVQNNTLVLQKLVDKLGD